MAKGNIRVVFKTYGGVYFTPSRKVYVRKLVGSMGGVTRPKRDDSCCRTDTTPIWRVVS